MKTATQPQTSKPTRPSSAKPVGRLYFLEASGGRIHSVNADGSDRKVIVSGARVPDGVVVDLEAGHIYWTDRGDPPRGNTVNRASIDADFTKHPTPDILLTHLMEGIGIALDFKGDRMFLTDLAGTIYSAKLDGTQKKPLLVAQGNLTGIAYAEIK